VSARQPFGQCLWLSRGAVQAADRTAEPLVARDLDAARGSLRVDFVQDCSVRLDESIETKGVTEPLLQIRHQPRDGRVHALAAYLHLRQPLRAPLHQRVEEIENDCLEAGLIHSPSPAPR
jgi:hypothetical protein